MNIVGLIEDAVNHEASVEAVLDVVQAARTQQPVTVR